jgi:hypothetical protein
MSTQLVEAVDAIIRLTDYSTNCRGLQAREQATAIAKHYFQQENVPFEGWRVTEIPLAEANEVIIIVYNQFRNKDLTLCVDQNGKLLCVGVYSGHSEKEYANIRQALNLKQWVERTVPGYRVTVEQTGEVVECERIYPLLCELKKNLLPGVKLYNMFVYCWAHSGRQDALHSHTFIHSSGDIVDLTFEKRLITLLEEVKDLAYNSPGGRSLVDECEMVPADPLEVWQVIRCTTNNGERIGIVQEANHEHNNPVLATVYSQAAAEVKSKELSTQLGIPEFNNDVDVWLE